MATLVLDNLPDALLSELKHLAALEHLPLAEKTVRLLQQAIGQNPPTGQALSAESWETAWRAWAAGHKTFPSAAEDDRDEIYAGRGE